jgi:hypothetical protein
MNTDLHDAVIPGFLLHWDLPDLVRAMGKRPVIWSDPVDWMQRPATPGPAYRYRKAGETAEPLIEELFR